MTRILVPSEGLPERYPCGRKRGREGVGDGEDTDVRMRIMLELLESKGVLSRAGREVVKGLQTITAASARKMICARRSL